MKANAERTQPDDVLKAVAAMRRVLDVWMDGLAISNDDQAIEGARGSLHSRLDDIVTAYGDRSA